MANIRRPPSYSDSYFILGGDGREPLEPLELIPVSPLPSQEPTLEVVETPCKRNSRRVGIFVLKSSIHVFLISVFETVFFFSYVSVTENAGILKTIDTYYEPVVRACPAWGNLTHWFLKELLTHELNVTQIDSAAAEALAARQEYNRGLFGQSLAVSGVCLGGFFAVAAALWVRRVAVPWKSILLENLMMVTVLGFYEFFFFRYIIYNYNTLSTPELNAHIVDGLWACVGGVRDGV